MPHITKDTTNVKFSVRLYDYHENLDLLIIIEDQNQSSLKDSIDRDALQLSPVSDFPGLKLVSGSIRQRRISLPQYFKRSYIPVKR